MTSHGKILIIDDEPAVRDVLCLHLEQAGYKIHTARDGEEAIQIMSAGANLVNVGLILCDIRMPNINGVETIEFLRQNAPSVPVMVITGYPDTELAVSLLSRGVKDYLVKPVEKAKLLAKVKEIMDMEQEFQYA